MKMKQIINNDFLEGELSHVDPTPSTFNNESHDKSSVSIFKEKIKFNLSSIDTQLYYNQLIIIGVYTIICLVSIITGDLLSLISPILMASLIVVLSSNPIRVKNTRFLDVGIWNLISSFNILIKGFNLSKITKQYKDITDTFTKLFIASLLLSGYPAFNTFFVAITTGLITSYLLCFINKDIDSIKESGKRIQEKELLFVVVSSIIFALAFKGSVANGTIFATLALLKYFHNSISELEINDITNKEN